MPGCLKNALSKLGGQKRVCAKRIVIAGFGSNHVRWVCISEHGSATSESAKRLPWILTSAPRFPPLITHNLHVHFRIHKMARRRSARLVARLAARAATPPQPNAPSQSPIQPTTPPLSVPSVVFPLLSLPPELTLRVASFLAPRDVLAMLLTSSAFAHLSTIFTILSKQNHTISEDGEIHVYTPLQFFSLKGNESVVSRLLQDGADPNEVLVDGQAPQFSPLVYAIGFPSAGIVSLLIDHGARINKQDSLNHGYSPLEIAVGTSDQLTTPFLQACDDYTFPLGVLPRIVQLLINAGADVNEEHNRRGTPLHIACAARNADPLIATTLIAAGADVHARIDNFGSIPLWHALAGDIQPIHFAAGVGNVVNVQSLLDAGVDIEARTRNGIRPLDNAVIGNSKDVFKLLIAAGADTYTDSALCNPITTTSRELDKLLIDAREFSGVPDPEKLLETGAQLAELMRWLDLRGCRPNPGNVGLWAVSPLRMIWRSVREALSFQSM